MISRKLIDYQYYSSLCLEVAGSIPVARPIFFNRLGGNFLKSVAQLGGSGQRLGNNRPLCSESMFVVVIADSHKSSELIAVC